MLSSTRKYSFHLWRFKSHKGYFQGLHILELMLNQKFHLSRNLTGVGPRCSLLESSRWQIIFLPPNHDCKDVNNKNYNKGSNECAPRELWLESTLKSSLQQSPFQEVHQQDPLLNCAPCNEMKNVPHFSVFCPNIHLFSCNMSLLNVFAFKVLNMFSIHLRSCF